MPTGIIPKIVGGCIANVAIGNPTSKFMIDTKFPKHNLSRLFLVPCQPHPIRRLGGFAVYARMTELSTPHPTLFPTFYIAKNAPVPGPRGIWKPRVPRVRLHRMPSAHPRRYYREVRTHTTVIHQSEIRDVAATTSAGLGAAYQQSTSIRVK